MANEELKLLTDGTSYIDDATKDRWINQYKQLFEEIDANKKYEKSGISKQEINTIVEFWCNFLKFNTTCEEYNAKYLKKKQSLDKFQLLL